LYIVEVRKLCHAKFLENREASKKTSQIL